MARTPLANAVEEAVSKIADEEARTTRRQLLAGAGSALAGASLLGSFARPAAARGLVSTRIVVVGAGLAGLTAAYRLQQAGYAAQVYEGSDRIGGRCWTGRGDFADGQIYEHGGELIDSNHIAIKQLAQELGLTLDNLLQAETKGTEQLGNFFGKPYTFALDTTVFFNGERLFEVEDETFKDAGGVGVWTKADSVTLFDDFLFGGK